MIKYFPFSYLICSRLKSKLEFLSWVFLYPLSLLWLILLFTEFSFTNVIVFFVSFIAVTSVYEIGYLYNDFITIKKELKPTVRDVSRCGFCNSDFNSYIVNRLFWFLVSIYTLTFYVEKDLVILFFVSSIIVLLFVFYLHNTIRSRWNILTFTLLSSLKYFIPVFLVLPLGYFWVVFFSFPFIRSLEHSTKAKYDVPFINIFFKNFDLTRAIYYFVIVLISIVYFDDFWIYYMYFFVFRLVIFLLGTVKIIERSKPISYKEK